MAHIKLRFSSQSGHPDLLYSQEWVNVIFLHLWPQKLYRAFRFGTLWPISCSYPRHSQLTRHSLMLANGRIRQSLTALVISVSTECENVALYSYFLSNSLFLFHVSLFFVCWLLLAHINSYISYTCYLVLYQGSPKYPLNCIWCQPYNQWQSLVNSSSMLCPLDQNIMVTRSKGENVTSGNLYAYTCVNHWTIGAYMMWWICT